MKDIKCPLCGEHPQFAIKDIDEIQVCQILCKCGLATEVNEYWLLLEDDPEEDELRAWKDWEKLISKFPPIMQAHVGDIIEYEETCDGDILNGRVTKRIFDTSAFLVEVVLIDDDGNDRLDFNGKPEIDTIYSFQVKKWPWELNQTEEKS